MESTKLIRLRPLAFRAAVDLGHRRVQIDRGVADQVHADELRSTGWPTFGIMNSDDDGRIQSKSSERRRIVSAVAWELLLGDIPIRGRAMCRIFYRRYCYECELIIVPPSPDHVNCASHCRLSCGRQHGHRN